jgi:hypothetical protein
LYKDWRSSENVFGVSQAQRLWLHHLDGAASLNITCAGSSPVSIIKKTAKEEVNKFGSSEKGEKVLLVYNLMADTVLPEYVAYG